jgi:NAD dependent epimerase/dehydratase
MPTPMSLVGQRALVTGAGGFIGSHLTERLVEMGVKTRAMVRYSSSGSRGWLDSSPVSGDMEIIVGDVRDTDHLRQALDGVDVVFHLAALISIPYSYQSPQAYIRTNIEGTANVLEAARAAGTPLVIQTSTSEVYGSARYVPIDEEHPLQGQSPYSASKIGADKLAEAFHKSFALPVATVRPFNTYGPRQSSRAIIPTIITQALTQPELHLGSLGPTRDFNFVGDTVEGFIAISQCPEAVGQVTNIGSGVDVSIGQLISTILEILGKDIPIVSDEERIRPPDSEVLCLRADSSKAQKIAGWQPKYSLEEGLSETITWIQSNLDRYRPDSYAV